MICDTCFDRETCVKRKLRGKHIDNCVSYFPDLRPDADRNPVPLLTPEAKESKRCIR